LPKLPDPVQAPLVRLAFEKYATANYNLEGLTDEMQRLGLRTKRSGNIRKGAMSRILNNRFYAGLIEIRRTGQSFSGVHQPIVGTVLFERVQKILQGKINKPVMRYRYLFRQLIACQLCHYSLVGEEQKGHIYYRCHTTGCPTMTIRQESLEQGLVHELRKLEFSQEEKNYFRGKILHMKQDWGAERQQAVQNLELRRSQLQERQDRLTDAFLDKLIDQDSFEQRKTALLSERCLINENLQNLTSQSQSLPDRLTNFLELAGTAYLAYKLGLEEEKRELVRITTSNRSVDRKLPMFTLNLPFSEVAKRFENSCGGPRRSVALVWDQLIPRLLESLSAVLPQAQAA
jgi:hypothetical protein